MSRENAEIGMQQLAIEPSTDINILFCPSGRIAIRRSASSC